MTLVDRIEKRIREIPASNPGYVSLVREDLGMVLSHDLLRKIAEEAAAEALSPATAEGE